VTPPFDAGLAIVAEADAHTLAWRNGGSLQFADDLAGPWQALATTRHFHRVQSRSTTTFYRVTHPRPATVYVPSSYDPQTPMPLILLLHGYGDSGQGVEGYMHFQPLAEKRGFLYCYPDATINYWGAQVWNVDDFSTDPSTEWGRTIADHAGYLRDLIEEIGRRFAVDEKRIYVTGRSGGGAMAYRMACQFSDLVAGIASHAGVSLYQSDWCRPSEPVHILRLHSLADRYWGGAIGPCDGFVFNTLLAPGALQTTQAWADYNGAGESITDDEPTMDLVTDVPGLDTIVTRYPNHPPGGGVELWTMTGGPHRPSFTAEYAPTIIDWLLAHPKP
jgi:polyhydroxybutyrate depolymerase